MSCHVLNIGSHDFICSRTLNIRGITRKTDQDNLIEEILEQGVDILGLSEIKLTKNNQSFAFKKIAQYKSISSTGIDKPYESGVLLLINNNLEKTIASIDKIEEYLIAVNLLSRKRNVFIAQVYLPNDKKDSQEI